MTRPPATFQGKIIWNLRDVFCGSSNQHSDVIKSSAQFLSSNRPGIFIVGGTNLTGKTSLIEKLRNDNQLLNFLEDENTQPEKSYIRFDMEFSDQNTTNALPKNITVEDLYRYDNGIIARGIEKGVKTIFLTEIWAGHEQALRLIQEELVRKHGFRVFVDVVSSGEGKGFFDSEANNHFIEKQMKKIFASEDLILNLLDFNRDSLKEGVKLLADYYRNNEDLEQNLHPFPRDLRKRLGRAYLDLRLDSELNDILDISSTGIENK